MENLIVGNLPEGFLSEMIRRRFKKIVGTQAERRTALQELIRNTVRSLSPKPRSREAREPGDE